MVWEDFIEAKRCAMIESMIFKRRCKKRMIDRNVQSKTRLIDGLQNR
ncbi:hypothetical protein NBRC111894_4476 [Sporolactobacillus inulinus]|uniref:Uncharacterized protein n=1 Tax=Sporolactobacillus inulinus TaxID=2078 RepID=A0A4Y1ZI99_9BACL|nr:hypothetical protein NBRC111894_4476 [Sporolactobacillus inulinus]